MALSPGGNLLEELTEGGRPYVFGEKTINAQRTVMVDTDGSLIGQDNPANFTSIQKKWKDSFSGPSLDANKWDIIQQGSGHTLTQSGGILTIATGTTINTETIIQSKETFTDPVRALFGFLLSQRITNQEFFLEFVSVDPVTLASDGKHGVSWRLKYDDYTSASTYAVYETWNGSLSRLASSAVSLGNALTSWNILELEMFADEVWWHSRAMDSANGRSASYVRHQQIPDPNALYKIRIRAKNLGTAPATSTNFQFQFVTVVDYSELTAEITAGRGNVSTGQSIGVQVLNSVTVSDARLNANTLIYTDTTTAQAAGATVTGTTRDLGSSYNSSNRMRVMVGHTAGLTPGHLVLEQSTDASTWRETQRVPIPSDANYRTFDFPLHCRYARIKFINGATAQTLMFLQTALIRTDGGSDYDKNLQFVHSTTALGISASFTGATLHIGGNSSFERHRAMVFADQAGTLYIESSRDGTTWRTAVTVAVAANTLVESEDLIIVPYTRVRFVNGATANTVFELYSTLVTK